MPVLTSRPPVSCHAFHRNTARRRRDVAEAQSVRIVIDQVRTGVISAAAVSFGGGIGRANSRARGGSCIALIRYALVGDRLGDLVVLRVKLGNPARE